MEQSDSEMSSSAYFQAEEGKSTSNVLKDTRNQKRGGMFVIFVTVAAILATVFASTNYYGSSWSNLGMSFTSSKPSMSVSVSSPGYDQLGSLSFLPFDTIAEPFKTQTLSLDSLTVDGTTIDVSSGGYAVSWSMCQDTDNEFELSGQTVDFQVDFVALCNCEVKAVQLSTGQVFTDDFTMAARYVRREIRSVSDADRETFLTALKVMYTLSDDEGQALYGSKFHSAGFYAAKHLNGAGVSDCDHWHDGAAILVKHMAYTLQVEQTLQSINAAIAMPYWEYGMDAYLYDSWSDSPMFQADWFGEEPTNTDHVISDGGLWDGVEVVDGTSYGEDWDIASTGSINPFSNAYGQLRSPWNNNNNTLISRMSTTYGMTQYSAMPTCSVLQDCFSSSSMSDVRSILSIDCMNYVLD